MTRRVVRVESLNLMQKWGRGRGEVEGGIRYPVQQLLQMMQQMTLEQPQKQLSSQHTC